MSIKACIGNMAFKIIDSKDKARDSQSPSFGQFIALLISIESAFPTLSFFWGISCLNRILWQQQI